MLFKMDWARLIFGKKFTVFLFFTLYYRTVSKYKPPPRGGGKAYIWRGDLKGRLFALRVWAAYIWNIYFWGAYTWRGLFSEFYGKTQTPTDLRKGNAEYLKNILKG